MTVLLQGSIYLAPYHFHYSQIGTPSQPTLLFLHGFLGSCHQFLPVMERLAQAFHCIALDLPGHGQTQVLGEAQAYGMAQTAQGIIQFLDQLNINKTHLVGYSMGGRLALYLALQFPERFDRVILESASPGLATETEQSQRRLRDQQLAQQLANLGPDDLPQFLHQWYNQPLFASLHHHPHFEKIWYQRLQNNPQQLAQSLRYFGLGAQPNLWPHLAQNQVPLLLLVGELDPKFIAINQQIQTQCPLSQLVIMAGCGHNLHLENLVPFGDQIQRFIGSQ
jgi:2-succinyl-6-hydroxy-2,4-cyclohexadiene-1-carboxylate synthase